MINKTFKDVSGVSCQCPELRGHFIKWLSENHSISDYEIIDVVNCIDNVSNYAIKRKISSIDFWGLQNLHEFQRVHNSLLNDIIFRISQRKLYKRYVAVGQKFMDFLHEQVVIHNEVKVLSKDEAPLEDFTIKEQNGEFTTISSIERINDIGLHEMISKILENHFPTGFRIGSYIELKRFRRFLEKNYKIGYQFDDEKLLNLIQSCGGIFNGKVFLIKEDTINKIRDIVDMEIKNGTEVIFYNEFFEKHERWLYSNSIISAEILKELLIKLYPKFIHKLNYFSTSIRIETELIKIGKEIKRVWAEEIKLNFKKLEILLPYIPIDKIKYTLSQDSYFIWESSETYTNIDKIEINDENFDDIRQHVAKLYQSKGFASLNDIPIEHLLEGNPGISLTAMQSGIFSKVLSQQYDKKGKIITRKGYKLNAYTILKEYCKEQDKCTMQELSVYGKDLIGEVCHWASLGAGYEIMIRINKNDFIAEKYIDFDTKEIDKAIEQFVSGPYLPIRGITTFAAFPHCNYPWNLFLLESYCRRFSQKFCFNSLTANSRNVGVIIRKDCSMSYHQIMADAVSKSDVPYEKNALLDFLYRNGYLGKRAYSKIGDILRELEAV